MTSFVYVRSEPRLWTVGHYDQDHRFHPESDHGTEAEAADRVIRLNGGDPDSDELGAAQARLDAAHDALTRISEADDDCFTTLESTVEYVVKHCRALAAAEEEAVNEVARLRAELERQRPVLEAARAWRAMVDDPNADDPRGVEDRLAAALDALDRKVAA